MCNFMSIITKGDAKAIFFDLEQRKTMSQGGGHYSQFEPDSHSSIADYFITNADVRQYKKDFADEYANYGKCDVVNKYEIVKGDSDGQYHLEIDALNKYLPNDSEAMKQWAEQFVLTNEFKEIEAFYLKIEEEKIIKLRQKQKEREMKRNYEKQSYAFDKIRDTYKDAEKATKIEETQKQNEAEYKKLIKSCQSSKGIKSMLPKEFRKFIR
jgi:hypothetical protein